MEMRADSGLTYPVKAKMIYVQLDKCLKQFRDGKNAEAVDGKPDQLQRWLAMIANVNDEKVRDAAKNDKTLWKIQKEMSDMAQDKEVRNMLMQERFDRMDWFSMKEDAREEGREEGREEERQAAEEKDQRRVRRMHDKGKSMKESADDMDLPLDTVSRWISSSSPVFN